MNWNFWNRRYYLASLYTIIVVGLLITYWQSFYHPPKLMIMPLIWPFLIGLTLAYFFNFLMQLLEKRIKRRALALTLTYLLILLLILGFVLIVAPQISKAMGRFIEEFPDFSEQIITQVKTQLTNFNTAPEHIEAIQIYLEQQINQFVTFNQNIVSQLIENLVIIGETLKNVVLGFVLSIYILAKKEMLARQFTKLMIAVIGLEKQKNIHKWIVRTNEVFGKFFVGMMLNSLIVGIATMILLFIFQIPFAILIGFIVAITNIIPIFGPFIGAIPSAIMIFFISPTKALIFVILILIIQQIDANIITPKIIGDKIGIASLWVLVATLVFGYFWGIIGMIVGVPITAILIEITREIVNKRLKNGHTTSGK